MPRPRTCNKISARSAGDYEPEIDVRGDSNNNCFDSVDSNSDEDSAAPHDGASGGIVKSLLGSGIEDAVLRTLEFGKSFIQKADDNDRSAKGKRARREVNREIEDRRKDRVANNAAGGEGDGEPDVRAPRKSCPEGRSTRKRVAFAAKPDKDAPLLADSKRLTNVSKIRSLDSDLKRGSPSPEKIKRQLEALIQINKDEPPEHAGHWDPFLKGPNRQVEVTVMPSLYVCRNELDLGYANAGPENMSTNGQEEQGSSSRPPSKSRMGSRPTLRGLGRHAPEILSSALGPTIDVSIINNLKMIRDLLTGGKEKQEEPNSDGGTVQANESGNGRPSDRGDVEDDTKNENETPSERKEKSYCLRRLTVDNKQRGAEEPYQKAIIYENPNAKTSSRSSDNMDDRASSKSSESGKPKSKGAECQKAVRSTNEFPDDRSKRSSRGRQYEFQVQAMHQSPMDHVKSLRDLHDGKHNRMMLMESSANQDSRENSDVRSEMLEGFRKSNPRESVNEKEKVFSKSSRDESASYQPSKDLVVVSDKSIDRRAPVLISKEKVRGQERKDSRGRPSVDNSSFDQESGEKVAARNRRISSRVLKDNVSLQEPSIHDPNYSLAKDRRKSQDSANAKKMLSSLLDNLAKTSSREKGNSCDHAKERSSSSENQCPLAGEKGSLVVKNLQSQRNSFVKECQTPDSLRDNQDDLESIMKTKMMEWKVEELQRRICELETKEKCLKKQIEKEEKEREKKRKFFEEEEEFMQFWKANWGAEGAEKPEKFNYEKIKWETAMEEERLGKLRDQSDMYKREIVAMEALQGAELGGGRSGSSEQLKRNKSLLDAWDVIASRVCHTRLPSFSRACDLERKAFKVGDDTLDIHCCFINEGNQAIGSVAETPARKSRSRSRCKCRSRSKGNSRRESRSGSRGPRESRARSQSKESQSHRSPRRRKPKQEELSFPLQRDITCGLHQSLKTCVCSDSAKNECVTCSSEDGLLKKLGAMCKRCRGHETPCKTRKSMEKICKKPPIGKHLSRSKSDTAVRPDYEGNAKIVKVMWAVTRINIFQDNCRTYEVMDATSTPPACVPCKTEGIFVVRNPQKASASTKRPSHLPGL